MYLKSLEVVGFKSFADQTTINFHPGVTAIVGPNGCGKSNVLDSIRWVLGETSAKALRGGQMQDVIFGGTDSRKPLNMAEVSLTFADCEKELAVDYNEVRISRRVFRDGRSEYEINKTPCRLKDIHKLFMDTGIGRSAYSIMEQGKIDQILSSKPEDRRAIFEEAAGITRFKSQKKEAMRKLELTEANLLRVHDIIKEVTRQIGSLQRQASKARRYKEMHQRLQYLDTRLAWHQYKEIKHRLDTGEGLVQTLQMEFEGIRGAVDRRENDLRQKRSDLQNLELTLRNLESEKAAAENAVQSGRQEISFNEQRIVELEELKERNRLEISANEEKLRIQQEQMESISSEYNESRSGVGSVLEELSGFRGRLDESKQAVSDNLKQRSRFDSEISAADKGLNESRNRLAAIDLQQRNHSVRKDKSVEEEILIRQQGDELGAKCGALARQIESEQATATKLEAAITEKRQQSETLKETLKTSRKEQEESQGSLDELQANIRALEKFIETRSGYSDSTKKLLAKFKGRGVSGTVLDFIKVEPGYERMIESCLGAACEAVLVKSPEILDELARELDQLGSGVLADVSHLPDFVIPKQRPLMRNTSAANSVSSEPFSFFAAPVQESAIKRILNRFFGGKQIAPEPTKATVVQHSAPVLATAVEGSDQPEKQTADQFVKAAGDVKKLVDRVLFEYAVVEDSIEAEKLRRTWREKHLVTRDGEIWFREGWQKRGKKQGRSNSVLEQENELQNLRKQLPGLQQSAEAAGKKLESTRNNITQLEDSLSAELKSRQEIEGKLSALNYEQQGLQRQRNESTGRLQAVLHERGSLQEQGGSDQEETKALQLRIQELEQSRQQKVEEQEALTVQLHQLTGEVEKWTQSTTECRVKEASMQQRLEAIGHQKQVIEHRVRELAEGVERLRQEISDFDGRMIQCRENIARAESTIEESRQRSLILAEEVEVQLSARSMQLAEVGELEVSVSEDRKKAGELQTQFSREEVAVAQQKMKMDNLTQRIMRSYQIDLTLLTREPQPPAPEEPKVVAPVEQPLSDIVIESAEGLEITEETDDENETSEETDASVEMPDDSSAFAEPSVVQQSSVDEENLTVNGSEPEVIDEPGEPEQPVDWDVISAEVEELRDKIDRMGPVNVEAITEYEELEQRATFLTQQEADLVSSRDQLHDAIRKINQTTRVMFAETFDKIQKNFSEMFVEIFGGGKADLILQDAEDPLECGIEIVARPPGKQLQSITLLSGGERTMTAVALMFSIYMVKPSPFCFLDEMDAPLDESNINRFIRILNRFVSQSQFCVITHNKRTISSADVLYGVTMEEHGVSKLVSVRLSRKEESPLFNNNEKEDGMTPSISESMKKMHYGDQASEAAPVASSE